jgi:hypothetical protein
MKSFCTRTSTLILSLLLVAAAVPSVTAHGYLWQVSVNGKVYKGNVPNGATNPSVIRQVSDISPVKGSANPDLNCGLSAKAASLVATANPGDVLVIGWGGGGGQNWPHNTGPLMAYMASCGSTTCDQFDSQTAKWFKIDQIGRQSDGTWVQQQIMNGAPANVTVPANIAPGNYILRHEIIALHLAVTLGGAEFYPSCTQFTIGGNGNGVPSADELVSFPGAYNDNDPGIFDPNIYDTSAPYTFPGPPIAQFVSGQSPPSSTGTASTPSSTPTGGPSAPNNGTSDPGYCRLRRTNAVVEARARPRHFSRIMRNLHRSSWY